MNQVFDMKRFTMLVAKHWSENSRKYTLGLIAIAGLLIFWYGFVILFESSGIINEGMQAVTYFVGLALAGCLYGSILFSDLGSGPKAMTYLIFPASHLEKLLVGLLYAVVFFFIAYTAVFYIVDIPMVKIGNSVAETYYAKTGFREPAGIVNVFWKSFGQNNEKDPNPFFIITLIYVAVQSAYILGSIYFIKFSFIKTTISLLLFSLLISLFVGKVLYPMLPDRGYYTGLTSFRVLGTERFDGPYTAVSLPTWIDNILWFLLKYAFAPLLWIVTYFRFKEKEA
jgi:hypothetical protein